jgi:hypothetical protein
VRRRERARFGGRRVVAAEAAPAADGQDRQLATARRDDGLAQRAVAVARDRAARDELLQSRLEVRLEQARRLLQVAREHRAVLVERGEQVARGAGDLLVRGRRGELHPVRELGARKQTDRRRLDRRRAAAPQATPRDLARERELVEPLAPERPHPARQHLRLPRGSRHFEPGELLDQREQPLRSVDLVESVFVRPEVLPPREEAQEIRRADRLDLLAQLLQRVAVDARRAGARTSAPCRSPACQHDALLLRA